jgi:hypothetical protein
MRAALAACGLALVVAAAPAHAQSCDEACLTKLADDVVAAVAAKDFRRLPWADPVRFTENNVPLMIGDAWWGSTGPVGRKAFTLADPATGNVVWFGTIFDHDEPSFGAIRLKAVDGRISELELIAGRKPWPIPYGDSRNFAITESMTTPVAEAQRRSRQRLVDLANGYLSTKQRNDGSLLANFARGCAMLENGVRIGGVESDAKPRSLDCADVFRAGLFAPVDRVRDRRFPVVDEARGLVLAISVQDLPAANRTFTTTDGRRVTPLRDYPMSRLVAELVRIEGDTVVRAEGVVASLPFGMPTPWKH